MLSRSAYRSLSRPLSRAILRPASASPPPTIPHLLRAYSQSTSKMALPSALNLPKWLEENSHLLKPPINNYCVTNDDVTVMIVGGPNARTDYHINSTPEFFLQYRGSMLLKTIQPSPSCPDPTLSPLTPVTGPPIFHDIPIREGELYVLPPNTPHNPIRFADTVGIVLEQKRPPGSVDRLRWYCRSAGCEGRVVREESFRCVDLGTQVKEAVERVARDEEGRRCGTCGEVVAMRPVGVVQP